MEAEATATKEAAVGVREEEEAEEAEAEVDLEALEEETADVVVAVVWAGPVAWEEEAVAVWAETVEALVVSQADLGK